MSKSERQAGLREQKDRFQQLSVNNLSFFLTMNKTWGLKKDSKM